MPIIAFAEPGNDTSDWDCNFCIYPSGWFGTLEPGLGHSSEADPKFTDSRGIDNEGSFFSLFGDVHYRDEDGLYVDLYAKDLGTNNRFLEMLGGRQGKYRIHVEYKEFSKNRGYGTSTAYLDSGRNQLTLPANWVHSNTTAGMSALSDTLNPLSLGTLRKTLNAALDLAMPGSWNAGFAVNHIEKSGARTFATGVFTSHSSFLPIEIDNSTDRLNVNLQRAGKKGHLKLAYTRSWFDNSAESITWENPFTPIGNTSLLRAALEPDSEFHQFNISGAFRPGPRFRISGSAAFGRARQNDRFLPYSINPDFADLTLPVEYLDQKLHTGTFNLAARLSAQISSRLRLSARARVDERDNQTPITVFTPVTTDLVLRPETSTRPYSFKRKRYSAELTYRAKQPVKLLLGIGQLDHQRRFHSVRETHEQTGWGELQFNQWSAALLRLRHEIGNRDVSPYLPVDDTGLQENVLMRKFNLAGRKRQRTVAEIDLAPTTRSNISVSMHVSNDDYANSILGLTHSRENSYSLDISHRLSQALGLHLFLTREDIESRIRGPVFPVDTPWIAETRDRFTTAGLSFDGKLSEKLNFRFDYIYSDSEGSIHTRTSRQEDPFPVLTNELRNIRLRLDYPLNHQWSWMVSMEHESYDSGDWQVDGLGNDGINSILTFGAVSPSYDANLVRLMAGYRFE